MLLAMLGLTDEAPKASKRGKYRTRGCGTTAGYHRHKDRGQKPCKACEDARRTYMRDWQRAHYTPERRRAKYEHDKARGYYKRSTAA